MRLMLLGEKLIALRDSPGKVGIMVHRCPPPLRQTLLWPQRRRRNPERSRSVTLLWHFVASLPSPRRQRPAASLCTLDDTLLLRAVSAVCYVPLGRRLCLP